MVLQGALLAVFTEGRRIEVLTGAGLREVVSNGWIDQMTHRTMVPHFKRGDYARGIEVGAEALIERISQGRPRLSDNDSPPALALLPTHGSSPGGVGRRGGPTADVEPGDLGHATALEQQLAIVPFGKGTSLAPVKQAGHSGRSRTGDHADDPFDAHFRRLMIAMPFAVLAKWQYDSHVAYREERTHHCPRMGGELQWLRVVDNWMHDSRFVGVKDGRHAVATTDPPRPRSALAARSPYLPPKADEAPSPALTPHSPHSPQSPHSPGLPHSQDLPPPLVSDCGVLEHTLGSATYTALECPKCGFTKAVRKESSFSLKGYHRCRHCACKSAHTHSYVRVEPTEVHSGVKEHNDVCAYCKRTTHTGTSILPRLETAAERAERAERERRERERARRSSDGGGGGSWGGGSSSGGSSGGASW